MANLMVQAMDKDPPAGILMWLLQGFQDLWLVVVLIKGLKVPACLPQPCQHICEPVGNLAGVACPVLRSGDGAKNILSRYAVAEPCCKELWQGFLPFFEGPRSRSWQNRHHCAQSRVHLQLPTGSYHKLMVCVCGTTW